MNLSAQSLSNKLLTNAVKNSQAKIWTDCDSNHNLVVVKIKANLKTRKQLRPIQFQILI